jgi:tetraacyldisaccharide 4'-kinase
MKTPFTLRKPLRMMDFVLVPLGCFLGVILWLRHRAYDAGWCASSAGDLPTIALGNLTVGGTGKTPHAAEFLRAIEGELGPGSVALLSRGYGRKTKGFRWVETVDSPDLAGDEPLMLKRQLPGIAVAVCEDRLKGLTTIRSEVPSIQWVVLDDALQHRKLRPTIRVLLFDCSQPVFRDRLIPAGRLRDLPIRRFAADAAVFSRSPNGALEEAVALEGWPAERPYFGSRMRPANLRRWPDGEDAPGFPPARNTTAADLPRILAVSGIARPERFIDELASQFQIVRRESYPDHHLFTPADARAWRTAVETDSLAGIVMTEKDAVRLGSISGELLGLPIWYAPLKVEWLDTLAWKDWLRSVLAARKNPDI